MVAKNGNEDLTALAISALVNICNYSDDPKDIFIVKNGLDAIFEFITSKKEEILFNVLRLTVTIINKSEVNSKSLLAMNDM